MRKGESRLKIHVIVAGDNNFGIESYERICQAAARDSIGSINDR